MDPASFVDDIATFLHDHMSEILNRCLNDDETAQVVRAVQRADAQAIAARNRDFTVHAAAVDTALTDARTAKGALEESLKNVKSIEEILNKVSEVLSAVTVILQAGVIH